MAFDEDGALLRRIGYGLLVAFDRGFQMSNGMGTVRRGRRGARMLRNDGLECAYGS